jgi:hypothetical protein
MTPALHLEILDLRHFSASNLKPVLEAESLVWNQRLRWDFQASANLLLQYLDSRLLPGYVAIENGRICGYVFCVYESEKALVGDVFAVPSASNPELTADVERRLLEHMIELLQHSPGVDRIESQLLLRPHGTHAEMLRNAGFQIYERLFMELELGSAKLVDGPPEGGLDGLELRSWRDSDFSAAGHLIAHAYEGHLDGIINDQYRSVAGSLRFLHNIVRFPGCGQFDPSASRVLVYRGLAFGRMLAGAPQPWLSGAYAHGHAAEFRGSCALSPERIYHSPDLRCHGLGAAGARPGIAGLVYS